MLIEEFPLRLSKLRLQKGVSARDMSLSIGQNAGYINNIETGKALPSLAGFFYICEYLEISPKDFFDCDIQQPEQLNELIDDLKQLDGEYIKNISAIVKGLIKSENRH